MLKDFFFFPHIVKQIIQEINVFFLFVDYFIHFITYYQANYSGNKYFVLLFVDYFTFHKLLLMYNLSIYSILEAFTTFPLAVLYPG